MFKLWCERGLSHKLVVFPKIEGPLIMHSESCDIRNVKVNFSSCKNIYIII